MYVPEASIRRRMFVPSEHSRVEGALPSRRPHDHNVSREGAGRPFLSPLSPLDLTLTGNAPACPKSRQITPLESIVNLLSPLELALTKNVPVSPLFFTLTKSLDKGRGEGGKVSAVSPSRNRRQLPLGFVVPLQLQAHGARIRLGAETVPPLPVSKPLEQGTGRRGSIDVQPGFRWVNRFAVNRF